MFETVDEGPLFVPPADIGRQWPDIIFHNPYPLPPVYWGVSNILPNLVDEQLIVRVFDQGGPTWNVPVAFLVGSEKRHIPLPPGNWTWRPPSPLKGKVVPTGNFGGGQAQWSGGAERIVLLTPEIVSVIIEGVYMKGDPLPHALPIIEISLYINGRRVKTPAEQMADLRQEVVKIRRELDELRGGRQRPRKIK